MKKKTIIVILCVLVAATVLCLLPLPSSFTATLNAVKLDSDGKEVGKVEIPVEYTLKGPVFKKELKSVSIEEFDGIDSIEDRELERQLFDDYFSVTFGFGVLSLDETSTLNDPYLAPPKSYSYRYVIKVSEDVDRWFIMITPSEGEEYRYVGSISGKYSTEELADFFK